MLPHLFDRARLRQRGYNQAVLLARAVSRLCGVPVLADGLQRTIAWQKAERTPATGKPRYVSLPDDADRVDLTRDSVLSAKGLS